MKIGEAGARSTSARQRDVSNDGLNHEDRSSLWQLLEEDLDVELHPAIKSGHSAVVRDLLRSGADPDAAVTAKDGDSHVVVGALHTAVDEGNLEIVRILQDTGRCMGDSLDRNAIVE